MPIRVDLPAPFGPSSPTISPLPTAKLTCDTARRRPKCRLTSTSETWSKSTIMPFPENAARRTGAHGSASGGAIEGVGRNIAAVESAVDVLERGEELLAPRDVPRFARLAAAAVLL